MQIEERARLFDFFRKMLMFSVEKSNIGVVEITEFRCFMPKPESPELDLGTDRTWYVCHEGCEFGPFSMTQLAQKVRVSEIGPEDLIKNSVGLCKRWTKANAFAFLQREFDKVSKEVAIESAADVAVSIVGNVGTDKELSSLATNTIARIRSWGASLKKELSLRKARLLSYQPPKAKASQVPTQKPPYLKPIAQGPHKHPLGAPKPLPESEVPARDPAVPAEMPRFPVIIELSVPADAKVWFDGQPGPSNGRKDNSRTRRFETPLMEAGSYVYDVEASVVRNGRVISERKDVVVVAGKTTTITMLATEIVLPVPPRPPQRMAPKAPGGPAPISTPEEASPPQEHDIGSRMRIGALVTCVILLLVVGIIWWCEQPRAKPAPHQGIVSPNSGSSSYPTTPYYRPSGSSNGTATVSSRSSSFVPSYSAPPPGFDSGPHVSPDSGVSDYSRSTYAPPIYSGSTYAPPGEQYVRPYFRTDGTYVPGHFRTNPDGNFQNNWSTKGNINPHTGKAGSRITPSSSRSRGSLRGR